MTKAVILPAAGLSSRFRESSEIPHKLWLELDEKPLLYWSIKAFADFDQLIVCTQNEFFTPIEKMIRKEFGAMPIKLVLGGETRAHSIYNGVQFLSPEIKQVFIHDAARPLVSTALIKRCLEALMIYEAVIPVCPLRDTLKQIDESKVVQTLDRSKVFAVQTPQAFTRECINQMYAQLPVQEFSDDAQLAESLGISVHTVLGERSNIKVTYQEDYLFVKALMQVKK